MDALRQRYGSTGAEEMIKAARKGKVKPLLKYIKATRIGKRNAKALAVEYGLENAPLKTRICSKEEVTCPEDPKIPREDQQWIEHILKVTHRNPRSQN